MSVKLDMSYKAKYFRTTKVKDILVDKQTGQKIHISADAKDLVHQFLDGQIEEAVQQLIDKLPRKSKGPAKGELKRITIKSEDFTE